MKANALKKQAILAFLMCVILLFTLSASTYAWFTINTAVDTSRVSARTDQADLSLLLSQTQVFTSSQCVIGQVNHADAQQLMPVSTSDLESFAKCNVFTDSFATTFSHVENEENLFHGRIFVRANYSGGARQVALYLDSSAASGGIIARGDAGSLLLNASRLGLAFEGNAPVILRLSNDENPAGQSYMNTKLDGVQLASGMVLDASSAQLEAVPDPAQAIEDYCVNEDELVLPASPLAVIQTNRTYALDIYFYLEGCDPDCTDAIYFDSGAMHIALFGTLN